MLKSIAAATALLLMAPQITLAEWLPVSRSSGGTISVNSESITRRGDIVSFWSRINFSAPMYRGIVEIREHISINCRNGLEQDHSLSAYNAFGKRIISGSSDNNKPKPIVPGTAIDAVAEFVCQ